MTIDDFNFISQLRRKVRAGKAEIDRLFEIHDKEYGFKASECKTCPEMIARIMSKVVARHEAARPFINKAIEEAKAYANTPKQND
jgi:hypothetical protein